MLQAIHHIFNLPAIWQKLYRRIRFSHAYGRYAVWTAPLRPILFCDHPWRAIVAILWPFPRHYPVPRRLSIQEIHQDEGLVVANQGDVYYLRNSRLWTKRDTPLRSLYRLYELLVLSDNNNLTGESEYFFNHPEEEWHVANMPDPQDPDPVRYAVLSRLTITLAMVCNDRISKGILRTMDAHTLTLVGCGMRPLPTEEERRAAYECIPPWTLDVPPAPELTRLFRERDDPGEMLYSDLFLKMNIVTNVGNMFFI